MKGIAIFLNIRLLSCFTSNFFFFNLFNYLSIH